MWAFKPYSGGYFWGMASVSYVWLNRCYILRTRMNFSHFKCISVLLFFLWPFRDFANRSFISVKLKDLPRKGVRRRTSMSSCLCHFNITICIWQQFFSNSNILKTVFFYEGTIKQMSPGRKLKIAGAERKRNKKKKEWHAFS